MKRCAIAVSLMLTGMPMAAWAHSDEPSPAVYERCLAEAAARVSHTDAPKERVFPLARRRCAGTRAVVAKVPQMLAALDAVDVTTAANFPDWIGRLRERRQLRAIGLPIPSDVGYR